MQSYTNRKFGPFTVVSGITRVVVVGPKRAVKFPNYSNGFFRGWLANQSEWGHRLRHDALTPTHTFFHLALVFPRAECPRESEVAGRSWPWAAYDGDEGKSTSWGWYRGECLLVDFDRAWERISFLAWCYYRNQDRKGRKWARR